MATALQDIPWNLFAQLTLAIVLGSGIGLERELRAKGAGLRTYAFVCLGATLFTIVSIEGFRAVSGLTGAAFDPSRIVQAIATGIGFIGGGIIIQRGGRVEGVTTAAGLWVVAAVGVALGLGLYALALFSTLLALFVFTLLARFSRRIHGKALEDNGDERDEEDNGRG